MCILTSSHFTHLHGKIEPIRRSSDKDTCGKEPDNNDWEGKMRPRSKTALRRISKTGDPERLSCFMPADMTIWSSTDAMARSGFVASGTLSSESPYISGKRLGQNTSNAEFGWIFPRM